MVTLNLSGHPVPWSKNSPLVGVNLDLGDPELLVDQLQLALEIMPADFYSRLRSGETVVVALPGMTPAAAAVLAILHGLTGHWPQVRWAVRGADGFEWPEQCVLDLDAVRLDARTMR